MPKSGSPAIFSTQNHTIMALYTVRITIPTEWVMTVDASSEEEATQKALEAEAPTQYAHYDEDEWAPDITEWPHVAGMSIEAEEQ